MPAQQKLLANAVMFLGGESRFAFNGCEALRLAREEPFDIVLMDLRMPELGGISAASHLLDYWKDMVLRPRIMAVTGEAPEETYPLCRAVGMDGYISKPYTMTALKRNLMLLLTQGHCWNEGPAVRLLDVPQIAAAMHGRDEASLRRVLDEARMNLLALRTQFTHLTPEEIATKAGALTVFAKLHGFVYLARMMDGITDASVRGRSCGALPPWAEMHDQFELTCRAAMAWHRQPQISQSLAA